MRSVAFAVALILPSLSLAGRFGIGAAVPDGQTYAEGWDREYGQGQAASATYQVKLKCVDVEKAVEKILRLMNSAGAQGSMGNAHWQGSGNSGGRTGSFQIGTDLAEATAKKLFALGDLEGYSVSNHGTPSITTELDARIKLLEQELRANDGAFKTMPISKFLLSRKLESYKRSRDSFESSQRKAQINVTVLSSERNP